ncbi:MAG: hypothetical protein JWQ27_2253 [Ferruginibacter sp.]|nr:hypothetical protein [Ferruginibacter sp.]
MFFEQLDASPGHTYFLNSLIDNKEAPSEPDSVWAFSYNPVAPPEPDLFQSCCEPKEYREKSMKHQSVKKTIKGL